LWGVFKGFFISLGSQKLLSLCLVGAQPAISEKQAVGC